MKSNAIIFFSAIVVLVCILLYKLITPSKASKAEIERLKQSYQDALARKDKAAAVAAGRLYYAALRGGEVTLYDEQAISNDLAAIQ